MRNRRPLFVFALLLIIGTLTAVWLALAWPPPRLLLKYGLPPLSALESLLAALGLGDDMLESSYRVTPKPYWAEIPRGFWLQERTLPPAVYEQCFSELVEYHFRLVWTPPR